MAAGSLSRLIACRRGKALCLCRPWRSPSTSSLPHEMSMMRGERLLLWIAFVILSEADHLDAIMALIHANREWFDNAQELEKVRRRLMNLAFIGTRGFFDARLRRHHELDENQLRPDDSGSQSTVRATGGLDVGLSAKRPPADPQMVRGRQSPARRGEHGSARPTCTSRSARV